MKKYQTEEERKAARNEAVKRWRKRHPEKAKAVSREANRRWRANNKEKIRELKRRRYQNHKEESAEYYSKYQATSFGRASHLVSGYRLNDKKYNRGECTLTADWIVENIFSQPCHYCGRTDWKELGCDRIDNSLPHTPDNVVPCCYHCNCKKGTTPYDEFMKKIGNN